MDRRTFLCASCALLASHPLWGQDWTDSTIVDPDEHFTPREARYYKKIEGGRVECQLCPHQCRVADKERGICGVRENRGGTYYTLVHSRVCALHIDPIEKKPLFHFLPGTNALSLATPGCNMWCLFCQNWQISQFRPEQVDCINLPPEKIHSIAKKYHTPTIAYTYSEPVIFTEYIQDTASLKEKTGIRSVMISNGFIQEKPLKDLCQLLDAIKVDLKSFSQKFYTDITGGKLKDVLHSLQVIRHEGVWLEIVVLIVPTLNDGEMEIRRMAQWIKKNLGAHTPVHFTRFHPTYRLQNLPVTPVSTLERSWKIAKAEGLSFVYIGNVPGHPRENTYCPKCGKVLIKRYGFQILENHLLKGSCPACHTPIPGVWS